MRRPRCRRAPRRSRGSTADPQRMDPHDRDDIRGTPSPPRIPGVAELGCGPEPRLSCVFLREVRDVCAARVFDQEPAELGARLVLRADRVADARDRGAFGWADDEAREVLEEAISLLDGERELAPWPAPRQFAGECEPRRADHEGRDELADDQAVRDPDLVELAVEPEPRDEDEGEQEKERGSDQESAQPIAHRITRSPARLRTARSRRAGCGRRCSGYWSAYSRIYTVAGTAMPQ